jgi:splicing factor 3B subunit 3
MLFTSCRSSTGKPSCSVLCPNKGSHKVFGAIRSMKPFRLTGSTKDYIVVGSDSGRISVLEFTNNSLQVVHMETFGKSGSRRIVPGQLMAVDPNGRAVMLGAIQNKKFTYVLNRDADMKLTISSPLESNKNLLLTFDMVGVDVGFENPIFACLEIDCTDSDGDITG